MITNVYVDGFNLYYGCLKGTSYKWLDLPALCQKLLPANEIKRIRYFTARVRARPDNPQVDIRQSTYLRALASCPAVSVFYGSFLSSTARRRLAKPRADGPRTVEIIKTEEKGSDVNLATYLLVDAFRQDAEGYVVISNDSDLKEPIRIVCHELGLPVGIINPHPPERKSGALHACKPTFVKQIREGAVASCQFPVEMTDEHGTFRKPAAW